MESIYIGFSYHKNNLLSKTIKLIENSNYSHVYIRRNSKYGEYVYQASGLQVNFMNIDIFKENNVVVEEYEFELPDEKKEKLITFFIKYAGADYSIKSLIQILLLIVCQKLNLNFRFNGDGNKSFICSELAAFFSKEIIEVPISDNLDFITPKKLNNIIKNYGKLVT